MKTKQLLVILATAIVSPAVSMAASLKTKSGTVFREAKMTAATADKVKIFHADGIQWVKLDDLTLESKTLILAMPNYATLKEAAERQDKADQESARAATEAADQKATLDAIVRIHFTCLKGRILQVLSDGVILTDCESWHGEHTPFKSDHEGLNHFMPLLDKTGNCFVVCDTTGLTDGKQFWQPVGLNGTYSYQSVLGAKITVEAYTSNLTEKAKALKEYRVPDADIVTAVTKKLDLKRYSYSTKIAPPPDN